MGTYVSVNIDDVVIPTKNQDACKQALLSLGTADWGGDTNEEMTLQEIIKAWRYESEVNEIDGINFGISITSFTGEKWGSDDAFWNTIGEFLDMSIDPYVEVKSHGETWVYDFRPHKDSLSTVNVMFINLEGVPDWVESFESANTAQDFFIKSIQDSDPAFDPEDQESVLDNGYYELEMGTFCIIHSRNEV